MVKHFYIIFAFLCSAFYMNAQCTLSATSSGGNGSYTQVYVLVDSGGDIVAQNTTGIFTAVAVGTYQIHALNYDPSNAPAPLPSALIGSPVGDVGSTTSGCFNADFLTDFVNRSCNSPACVQSNDVCENEDIIATSSGSNATYTQVYVLADDNGDFLAQNTTGIFPTTALSVGNTYHVYALNYDPSDAPSPLPSGLSVGDPLSDITGGCFNGDFLTDYVCFNIINCACTPTSVCNTASIIATSSGGNASYTQVYVLADDSGNFVAQNSTGTFSASALTIGSIYQVHALNYNPSDAPLPLPSGLAVGDPLSDITGGCFNADFLTDFVCFEITCCGGPTGFIR